MRQGVNGVVATTVGLGAILTGCGAPAPTPALDPGPTVAIAQPAADAATLVIGSAAVDTTGGLIPDGQTASPFDDENPVVGFLDPLVRSAIQDAARAAAAEGVDVRLTSGWRSKGFQQRLFDDAVVTYGSVDAASQFVASPEASMHVFGRAVDVGPAAADEWMIRNGPRFGLCQIYANEIWHFELAVDDQGNCPPLRPNAAG
jgi:hypothetical protein